MKKYNIVIIGGTSDFGQLWKKYFEEKGNKVIVSTNSTTIKPKDAVKKGDIIIISVPIRHTVKVIKELIPYIDKNKLLIDFTGIKTDVSKVLKEYKSGEIISIHPMFGPWIKSFKNQNISYDPILPGIKWNYIKNLLKNDGANLIELKAEKHDELISIVQSSVHIINLMLGHILKKRNINLEDIMKISTPNSRMQLLILSRFLNQNANLYTDMQMYNSMYENEVLNDIKTYFNFIDELIKNKEIEKFENEFNDIKDFLGKDILKDALEKTQKINNIINE